MDYIEPHELKAILSTQIPQKDYLIIDVRGDDFFVGNIPGCRHIPSHEFLESACEFVKEFEQIPLLVFHCALSQVRGPKCMQRYRTLRDQQASTSTAQRVRVLRGGFANWLSCYKNDPSCVEHVDHVYWENQ
jgi:Cdc25 family phosphatase